MKIRVSKGAHNLAAGKLHKAEAVFVTLGEKMKKACLPQNIYSETNMLFIHKIQMSAKRPSFD